MNKSVKEIVTEGLQRFFGTDNADYMKLVSSYQSEKFNDLQKDINYFFQNISDIKKNWKHYEETYLKLYDSVSKDTFLGMLYAKVLMDPKYIEDVYSDEIIYFDEKIWGKFGEETYVDCGGYTGDTVIKFVNRCPQYKKIIVFEALPVAAKACNKRLDYLIKEGNLRVLENAVSDRHKRVYMSCDEMKGDGKISEMGNIEVQAVSIDQVIKEPISLIKMDIEGSEKEAILGCQNIIKQYTPKLAICIYHLKDDFWRIPELIMGINPNYNFIIRQHDPEVFDETVLYCVPKIQKNEVVSLNYTQVAKRLLFVREELQVYDAEEQKNILQHINDKKWFLFQIRQYRNRENELKEYIEKLEAGKEWLSNQLNNYKTLSSKQEKQISELKDWINELETGKRWLEEQWEKKVN